MVIKIFVYLLITNPSLYENIENLFERDMKTQILFELSEQPFENFLVFSQSSVYTSQECYNMFVFQNTYANVLYGYTTWQRFIFVLQYSLTKIFRLKLPDDLVNLGKISTGQNRNLTRSLHCPALISTPAYA